MEGILGVYVRPCVNTRTDLQTREARALETEVSDFRKYTPGPVTDSESFKAARMSDMQMEIF